MNWTMPRRALQIVAALIGLAAIGSFAMGVLNAPQRGRLPGENAAGAGEPAAAIEATDATPLSQERIEGPPPPPELTPEEKARLDAEKKAKAEAEAEARAQAEAELAARNTATPPNGAVVRAAPAAPTGNLVELPPADEPPH